jgi:hypothetical protein
MSARVTFEVPPAVALRRVLASAVLLASAGCGETWHAAPTLDCSEEGSYDIAERYSAMPSAPEITSSGGVLTAGNITWYDYGDTTPGGHDNGDAGDAAIDPTVDILVDGGSIPWTRSIPGGRCGSTAALVLTSSGFHDYGSGYRDYNLGDLVSQTGFLNGQMGLLPYDASKYQGIAFWARSPGATTKAVTLQLTDGSSTDNVSDLTACTYEMGFDDAGMATTTVTTTSPNGTTMTSTGVSLPPLPPGICGNNFSYVFEFTDEWQLYKIPFSAFFQAQTPNRAPGGFDPSTFFVFGVVVPKEVELELWIDELGFYPKADGGLN